MLNTALLINFASARLYTSTAFTALGVIALVIVPGLYIGERVHHKLDAARFERVVWAVLLVAGLALAIRYGSSLGS